MSTQQTSLGTAVSVSVPAPDLNDNLRQLCSIAEKAAAVAALSPWAAPWIQHGMHVVKAGGRVWEARGDQLVGPVEALGCGGWDEAGALHHVGFDLDVAHGNEKDAYGSTDATIQAASKIRDKVGGAAEIRLSKGGRGIHVRIRIALGAVPANGRKIAALIAKWIANELGIKCDRTVLGRQNLWLWAREVGQHGFELIEACVGNWMPPPDAMQEPVAKSVVPAVCDSVRHDVVERAARYAERMPPAVSGNGGHDAAFHAVCTVVHGFDLNESESMLALQRWNRRCSPPWNETELRHKVLDALKQTGERGHLLRTRKKKTEAPAAVDIAVKFLDVKGYRLGTELRLRYYLEDYWRWTGTRYELIRAGDMEAEVVAFLQGDPATRDAAGPALARMVLSNLSALTLVQSSLTMPVMLGDKPEPAHDLIVLQNGVLDVTQLLAGQADVLRPHSPNLFTATALPFEYRPGAKCPTWRKFLKHVQPDPQVRRLLREWLGYCLVLDVGQQKFLMLLGDGANGKTVVCAAMKELLGESNVSAVGLEAFNPARTFPLAAMDGKLANISAEIGEMDRAAEGLLKQFVAGDPITVERKHRDPFLMTPTARLVFATNLLPRFVDRTDGIWRRLLLVPFNVQIPEALQDRRLVKPEFWRSSGELAGILNWALLGLRRLRRRGRFQVPAACMAAAGEYRAESNPAREFINEHCVLDPNAMTWPAELYAAYQKWAEESGYRPLGANYFGREVRRAFPTIQQLPNPIKQPGTFVRAKGRPWVGLRYDQ